MYVIRDLTGMIIILARVIVDDSQRKLGRLILHLASHFRNSVVQIIAYVLIHSTKPALMIR